MHIAQSRGGRLVQVPRMDVKNQLRHILCGAAGSAEKDSLAQVFRPDKIPCCRSVLPDCMGGDAADFHLCNNLISPL